MKSALAIEQVIRLRQSPVNTHALSERNSGETMWLAAGAGKRQAFQGAVVVMRGRRILGSEPPPGFTEPIGSG